MKFENNTVTRFDVNWLACGGRGGCFSGGRLGPTIDLDFNDDEFNIQDWCHPNFTESKNYWGKHFKIRPVSGGGTAEENIKSTYGLSQATYNTLINSSVELRNGCNIDAPNASTCGPFGLYFETEKALGLTTPNLLITANKTTGARVYADTTVGRNTGTA